MSSRIRSLPCLYEPRHSMQALRSPLQRTGLPTAPTFLEGKRVSIGVKMI
jgi:hypothetical protein